MGHSIRWRIILVFIGLAVGPVLIIGVLLAVLSRNTGEPAPVSVILAATGLAAVAVAGIAVALGLWIAGRLVQPLETMTEAAEAIVTGDLTPQTPAVSDDEIGILAGTFNHMARKVRDRIGALERRTAAREKALAVVREVSRLSAVSDEKRLAAEVVEQVKKAFIYYHVLAYFYDPAGENLIIAGGTGEAGRTMLAEGYAIPKGDGSVGRAAERNTPVLVGDTSRDPSWLPNPRLPKTKSEAAIPISLQERVLGVLDVQQNIVNGLTQEDVDLLQPIADQIAFALRYSRPDARLGQESEREALISSIARKIRETKDVEDALQVAACELGRALDAEEIRIVISASPEVIRPESEPDSGE
jgi:nitrate/nitrite-specific signal transduction histidine kinase